MINTILFDLDGTLLKFTQQAFIGAYFAELTKVFDGFGLDAKLSIEALWIGTKAMVLNDGSRLNKVRFWTGFAEHMKLSDDQLGAVEAACDSFYSNEFNRVKAVLSPSHIPQRLVRAMASKGYDVVLATNPLFPLCAVESRLGWTGLEVGDFLLVTHYANSSFCKPNHGYYREVFDKIGKTPQQCLMVGNNPAEDMCVGALGAETFLVTDSLENEAGLDISVFRHGSLADCEEYLNALPDVK